MPKLKRLKNKYFIIGSNSFSGSSFINFLLNKNYEVAGISRSKELEFYYSPYFYNKNKKKYKFKKINIVNKKNEIIKFIKNFRPSVVVNYAAQGMVEESWYNPEDWYQTNLVSQSILYKEISKFKFIKKFIHISTPEVYGNISKPIKENFNFNPTTPYAISRAAMDLHLKNYFKHYKLPVIFTRTANIYGPYQPLYRIVPKALISAKKGIKLDLHGGGNSIRSFIYSGDVSNATYIISKKGKLGETYHISNNSYYTVKNLVKKISKLQNVKFENLCNISKDRIGKDYSYKLSFDKLKKLGWLPKIDIEEGLSKTKKWIDQNFINLKKLPLTYKHKK